MRKFKTCKVWIPALILAVVIAGCGDPDKNSSASNPGAPLTPPTVAFVTPPDGNVGVCPNANPVLITAVFSKAMNPATIGSLYVYFDRARRDEGGWGSHLRRSDQYCHLYTVGPSFREHPIYRHYHYWGA